MVSTDPEALSQSLSSVYISNDDKCDHGAPPGPLAAS